MSDWKGISQKAIDEVKYVAQQRAAEEKAAVPNEPASLAGHAADYKPAAWEQYTMAELGQWVHLLTTRAHHRDNPEKRAKDLYDAQNYLDMMQTKLDAAKGVA